MENIQDIEHNVTRFVVLGQEISRRTGDDKTSLIYGLVDRPGSLYRSLEPFALRNINLTKIESRPSKRKLGEYIFFVDFQGHIEDEICKDALKDLNEYTTFVKILGSYPYARI